MRPPSLIKASFLPLHFIVHVLFCMQRQAADFGWGWTVVTATIITATYLSIYTQLE